MLEVHAILIIILLLALIEIYIYIYIYIYILFIHEHYCLGRYQIYKFAYTSIVYIYFFTGIVITMVFDKLASTSIGLQCIDNIYYEIITSFLNTSRYIQCI